MRWASGWLRWRLTGTDAPAAGLAFLAKGFLAFAVPGLVALVVLTWERRWGAFLRDLARRAVQAAAAGEPDPDPAALAAAQDTGLPPNVLK